MRQTRIGISGWRYTPWRDRFYPSGLSQNRELYFASRKLNSIEINGSFYSLQLPGSYQTWYEQTPEDFVFSLKGGRYITHMKRLKEIEIPLANFLASGVLCLKEKLGPILWQFPPQFAYEPDRFAAFFELLPRDTQSAAKLAKKHDPKMKARAWTKSDANRPLRHAVEIRHPSFMVPEFFQLLRKHNIAFVMADTAHRWPFSEDVTADFLYVRLHGEEELYVSGYTDDALKRWAKRLEVWRSGKEPSDARRIGGPAKPRKSGRDLFVYFDNDVKVYAPANAMDLASRLGVKLPELEEAELITKRKGSAKSKKKPLEPPRSRWPGVRTRKRA